MIKFKNKKIFISGGRTGFLGTNLAKVLWERGAYIYVHSFTSEKPSNFAPGTPRVIESVGDLSKSVELPDGIDYVFHCAAHTSGAKEMATNPVAQITSNVFMNSLLLDAAAKAHVKKFLFISSSAIYPESNFPLSEDKGFDGDPPGNYFGPAWMKRYTEKLAYFYHRWYGMEVVIIRPSNVYGPYSSFNLETAHVLPALIRKFVEKQNPLEVWGWPDVVRDFVYVEDFVRGALLAFERSSGFDVFNIADGKLHTIAESVHYIKELTNYSGEIIYNSSKPTTIRKRIIDPSKAKRILEFSATTPFHVGLQKTIDWYKNNLTK